MIGVYFSGTGNTKYCLEKFVALYDGTSKIVSLEASQATGRAA